MHGSLQRWQGKNTVKFILRKIAGVRFYTVFFKPFYFLSSWRVRFKVSRNVILLPPSAFGWHFRLKSERRYIGNLDYEKDIKIRNLSLVHHWRHRANSASFRFQFFLAVKGVFHIKSSCWCPVLRSSQNDRIYKPMMCLAGADCLLISRCQ